MMNLVKKVVMVVGVIAIMGFMTDKAIDKVVDYGITDAYEDDDCIYAEAVKSGFGSYTFKFEYKNKNGIRHSYEEDLDLINDVIDRIIG